MDCLHARKEVSALKKLREEYERQLKLLGFELCDLPDEQLLLLVEYAEIKSKTKIIELNKTYLDEYVYNERREQINNSIVIKKLVNDILKLENNIENENTDIKDLKNFTNLVNSRIVSSSGMDKNIILMEQKITGLKKIEDNLSIPKDLNIDDLIAKVEILEERNKLKKK